MSNGVHHSNYAVATLEKELQRYEEAFKGWSESSIVEYREAYKRVKTEIKQIEQAIEILKQQLN